MLLDPRHGTGQQTRWVQIGRMVREALASKSLAGQTIDRVAAAFIPGVLLLAAATAWFWWSRGDVETALLAGLAVLVVACPCSLGLAAPLASALAIGQAAQRGILIRSGGVLERLARLRGIAFDKTGTLTSHELLPLGWQFSDGANEAEVLRRAAMLARGSDHPIARAVARDVARHRRHRGQRHRGSARRRPARPHRRRALRDRIGSVHRQRSAGRVPAALQRDADDGCTTVFVGWAGQAQARLSLAAAPIAEAAGVIAALRDAWTRHAAG